MTRYSKILALGAIAAGTLAGVGCSRSTADQERRDSAARKVGHAAYGVAQESKEAAKKAGHELREASRDMHEGWKEAKQESREKKKRD